MQWTQKKKYLAVAIGAFVLGGLVYGGKQYFAARELARLNDARIDGGWYASPLSYQGAWHLVPPNEVFSSGIEEGAIPTLTNPKTTTISEADKVIADDLGGISVEINGEARFYPVQIMNWHEVVHDTLGGESILVYYGPLTGTAAVYNLPEGKRFVVSGKEYNNDVLLKEEGTETLWSGVRGTPVVAAEEAMLSASLTRLPAIFMTWGEWKDSHDSGTVLSTDTGYTRDYTRHPYGNYENSPGVYFPVSHSVIPVRAKEPAYVVQFGKESALVLGTISVLDQTPSIEVGGECVVALRNTSVTYANIFSCTVDGRKLSFTRKDSATFIDTETGSSWDALRGRAFEGELAGKELASLPAVRLYTFAADALFPKAIMIGSEFVFEEQKIDAATVDAAGGALIEGENTGGAVIEVVPNEE
jgi:hypothetical protein